MAINVNNLPSYVEEHRLPLLRKAVIENKTAALFNLQTGIKGATALNLLSTEVTFGDGKSCGWNEAGTSTLSQRILTPGAIKINTSFCDKTLLSTWANYEVRVAAGQKTLPFEEDFLAGVVDGIKANLEKAMWAGDTTSQDANLNKFNGIVKIGDNATTGIPAANVYAVQAGATATAIVNGLYNLIPAATFAKGEVVMYISSTTYRKYIQELIANGNLVITTGVNDVAMPDSILIPGTNVRVYGVDGLNGTGGAGKADRAYASYKDNFIYGVDLQGDEEKMEMWYSQDNREFRLAVEFIAGVQIAYPDMMVTAKES